MNWFEYPALVDRVKLYRMIIIDGLSSAEISQEVGCTPAQVKTAVKNHDFSWLPKKWK